MKTALIITLFAITLLGATKRDWKAATLLETAHVVAPGASHQVVISASPRGPGLPPKNPQHIQGFRIEGNGYRFLVACPVGRDAPNVTVNGTVKYSIDKGKFYLLDEDGKEFHMTVLEKTLMTPSPATPKTP